MARLVLALLLASLVSPAAAGPCAVPGIAARPMTPAGTAIAPGGGVMVSLVSNGFGHGPSGSADLVQKTWRFKIGGKLVAPQIKVLAPGLATYELPDEGDAITLVDDTQKDLVAVKRAPAQPELAAPSVKAITHHTYKNQGRRNNNTETRTVTLQLASPPPKEAVAIILYNGGTAASWSTVFADPTGKEFVLYSTPGRCSFATPGTTEVPLGARAQIAFVDASGRVSAKSKDVIVVKGKPPAGIGP